MPIIKQRLDIPYENTGRHKKLNGELQLSYKSYAGGIETYKQQHKLFQKGLNQEKLHLETLVINMKREGKRDNVIIKISQKMGRVHQ
jgi:hypothetical protein